MVGLLALAHDRDCEADLAQRSTPISTHLPSSSCISMRPACRSLPSSKKHHLPKLPGGYRCESRVAFAPPARHSHLLPDTRRERRATRQVRIRGHRQPGQSQGGQPTTRALGSWCGSAYPHLRAPDASVPMTAPYTTTLNIATEHRHRKSHTFVTFLQVLVRISGTRGADCLDQRSLAELPPLCFTLE